MRAPLTMQGAQRLRQELDLLKTVKRPEVITAIAEARAHGDLKENAEYHAARDKQSFTEGRVKELEDKLARAEIIVPSQFTGDRVMFGATVKLSTAEGEEISYRIVGSDESDTEKGWIGVTSPLARSLVGKEVGDEVKARTPGGEREYEILSVSYK